MEDKPEDKFRESMKIIRASSQTINDFFNVSSEGDANLDSPSKEKKVSRSKSSTFTSNFVPINESKGESKFNNKIGEDDEYSLSDEDEFEKDESGNQIPEKKIKQTIRVLMTGSIDSGKNMLFCRLISEFCNIPFRTIRKNGLVTDSIKISVLKGFAEDKHYGSIREDAEAPIPYLDFVHENIKYIFYYPVQSNYYARLLHSKPIVDILIHVFDADALEKSLEFTDVIKQIRFKEILFCVNKMDCIENVDDLNSKKDILKKSISELNLMTYYDTRKLEEFEILAVSSKKDTYMSENEAKSKGLWKNHIMYILSDLSGKVASANQDMGNDEEKTVMLVDNVSHGNVTGTLVSGTVNKKTTYIVLPGNHEVRLKSMFTVPTYYKVEFVDDEEDKSPKDSESKNMDNDNDNESQEPPEITTEELKKIESDDMLDNELLDDQDPYASRINSGDVIVSTDSKGDPILHTSNRLMVSFKTKKEITSLKLLISEGFKFKIVIHRYKGEASIESIDGVLDYDSEDITTYEKNQTKFVKGACHIICKIALDNPIVVENYDKMPVMANFLAEYDGEYIGRGKVIKHVPYKP